MAAALRLFSRALACAMCVAALAACSKAPDAQSLVERGRYLVLLGGCNECHTDGFVAGWPNAKVPESEWLTGSAVGYRGPWGTTYPTNLRLRVTEISEDDWAQTLHTRTSAPPMPWSQVNSMTDGDARAVYAFIKSLGPKGAAAPAAAPPSEEPSTAYIWMMPMSGPAPAPISAPAPALQ